MAETVYSIGILEDDPEFREFLVSIVEDTPGFEPAFACETVAEGLAAFDRLSPDLVLVDMQLPDGSGLDLIRRATSVGKLSLMLTILADRKTALAAFEQGVHGYLLKDSSPQTIRDGIEATLSGESPVSPAIAVNLLQLVRRIEPEAAEARRPTERELTILNMIARGLTYAEVAQAAGISVHTVGDHVKAIYRKLDVRSKSEAVHEARQLGWLGRFD